MDYCDWGAEYLALAGRLKEHTGPLRKELKKSSGEEKILLIRRIVLLDEMRLECLRTGKDLVERGRLFEQETES